MRLGESVRTAAGCELLRNDIEARTGERLSINTIKRIVGVIQYEGKQRLTTLNILGKYMGYTCWDEFIEFINGPSGFVNFMNEVHTRLATVGQEVKLQWFPDRTVVIKKQEGPYWKVIESANSKLQVGDVLLMSKARVGWPLNVRDVKRRGVSLGPYRAAEKFGLSTVKRLVK